MDFGYTETTVTGSVRMELEQFEFCPLNKKETWWFSPVIDTEELSDARGPGRTVATLTGFLSPEREIGGYGHFAAYKREFVVTKIKEIKEIKEIETAKAKGK